MLKQEAKHMKNISLNIWSTRSLNKKVKHEHEHELHNENRRRASRAKRGERGAPPLHGHKHEHEHTHEHEYKLHNENGRRASRAKRGERGAPPCTDMNSNMSTNMNTTMNPNLLLLGSFAGIFFCTCKTPKRFWTANAGCHMTLKSTFSENKKKSTPLRG